MGDFSDLPYIDGQGGIFDPIDLDGDGVMDCWRSLGIDMRITSSYGYRILNGQPDKHNGIDYVSDFGDGRDTRINSIANGTVAEIRTTTALGLNVRIHNADGTAVVVGQEIAGMGDFGTSSVHLHLVIFISHSARHNPNDEYSNTLDSEIVLGNCSE